MRINKSEVNDTIKEALEIIAKEGYFIENIEGMTLSKNGVFTVCGRDKRGKRNIVVYDNFNKKVDQNNSYKNVNSSYYGRLLRAIGRDAHHFLKNKRDYLVVMLFRNDSFGFFLGKKSLDYKN